ADNSLTGSKIVVSTLGEVPLAKHSVSADSAADAGHAMNADQAANAAHAMNADQAANAGHAMNADQAANAVALGGLAPSSFERAGHLVLIAERMSNTDPDRTILTAGPFKVIGHCAAANVQQNVIGASATTSENDSAVHGHNFQGIEAGNADFDIGTTQQLSLYQESGTPPSPSGPFPTTWFMASPSGTQVALTLTLATRVFSDDASKRVACVFGGFAVVT
ncbi:MAG: hypothetical protein J2P17_14100, partial [Mycobacterium sp.]|nr:hypothetical protein [Mycobacterium sp.]